MEQQQQQMTEITKPQKFLFDLTFDENGGDTAKEREVTYSQEQLDAACKEARDAGHCAGQKAAHDDGEHKMNALLESISERLVDLTDECDEVWREQLVDLQRVSLAIVHKLIPAYVARYGSLEVEAIVRRVVSEMNREPRLVVRVAETCFEELDKQIDEMKRQQAFAGEIVVLGDPALAPSDCRIEWAKGGVERDMKSLGEGIDAILANILGIEPPPADTWIEPPVSLQAADEPPLPEQAAPEPEIKVDMAPAEPEAPPTEESAPKGENP